MGLKNKSTVEKIPEAQNKETLAALRKSEDEKQAILDGLRGLVMIRYMTPDLRIVWSNTDIIKEPGTKNQSAPPSFCYKLLYGRSEPCANCEPREALATGQLSENEESSPAEGQYFIARAIPMKDTEGTITGVIHIALNITRHKEAEAGLKTTNEFLNSLLENSPTPICVSDHVNRINTVNEAWERTLGFRRDEVVGKTFRDIFPAKAADTMICTNMAILESNAAVELEESVDSSTGLHHFHTVKFPLQDTRGQTVAVGSISVDVTARKRAEQDLTEREAELNIKSRQLEEMNTALKVLLKQRNEDQRELEERIVSNIKELVLPYVHKLKGMHLNEAQASYLEIIGTHLNHIVAPFLRQILSEYPHMTAKELQVATLVREGKANKEIADLMNVSLNTIEIHRYNLRKKLGLRNKKINLRSYLLSLNKMPR